MLKKTIILIILISIGGFAYKYILPFNINNNVIINIESDEKEYKFKPDDKEGHIFNGESLKIYRSTREKLLPNEKNNYTEKENNKTEKLVNKKDEDINIKKEGLGEKNKIYLQLGSYKTLDKAKLFIKDFLKVNTNLVKDLKFNIVSAKIEDRGTYFRVRLGPFIDNKEIFSLCIELKLVNNECLIVKDT